MWNGRAGPHTPHSWAPRRPPPCGNAPSPGGKREIFVPPTWAVYPAGSFYVRHLDRFQDAPHRAVTVILYLNPEWQAADWGLLRIFLPQADGTEKTCDVPPLAGTLVTFLSGEFPHEVLPTTRERLSVTGWFCTRREG